MERGGFDAIIGNPPFLGARRFTGAMGDERSGLVRQRRWPSGQTGSADLVAYFFLRAFCTLDARGNARPDRDEYRRARRHPRGRASTDGGTAASRSPGRFRVAAWPAASANLEYAAVWGTRGDGRCRRVRGSRMMSTSARISTLLEPAGRVEGVPHTARPRTSDRIRGLQSCSAMGSCSTPRRRRSGSTTTQRTRRCCFPYLNGEDLNSQPGRARRHAG